ncbi:MAG: 4Fe-4S binding protein, partial [Candidatus Krumholzibacteria bacterium]|nr:4Fe-4S binding protein [Candidatus Krumholzibacteria bacterium]
CDVEEPNGHIYLKPEKSLSLPVAVEVPEIDESKCTVCGKCGEICEFMAIAVLGDRVMVFPELCHGCGGCFLVCPVDAMKRSSRHVGRVEAGISKIDPCGGDRTAPGGDRDISFVQGILKVKEAMPLPVIREVKKHIPDRDIVIIDCPPGNSCPMVESVRGADRVILVTEPTPFGFNDLEIALTTVREMNIPVDIILNRCDPGSSLPADIFAGMGSDVIARIPESREIAKINSRGGMAALELPEFAGTMDRILEKILRAAREVRR